MSTFEQYLRGALGFFYVVLKLRYLDGLIAKGTPCHVFEAEIVMQLKLRGLHWFTTTETKFNY